ncbi:MAG TPA: cadmium resistance transporter [Acidimicrobiales bacterium]|jgi:cadmium resistance protein CadD (predicted permease)|nr:cadmium resistance transporter [Acidimicrobiales bacterium]
MFAGLLADAGVAVGAFVGTNLDNALVSATMVALAPPERTRRIALGQVLGFAVLVVAAAGTALALFEISPRVVGLLGLVPLALGIRGLVLLRQGGGQERLAHRAVGKGVVAATFITVAAGGDNLAVYIPLFRSAGLVGGGITAVVFLAGEFFVTLFILRVSSHPTLRRATSRIGLVATPILYCLIGVVVLVRAGTF